jgi:lipoyl(octanoyl) transferase
MQVRQLGLQPYSITLEAMRRFTRERTASTPDELWLVEHRPVFTLGLAGKTQHLLNPGDIEIQRVERGGQVTYHGPGQIVAYTLFDLQRLRLGVRELVCLLEQSVIDTLLAFEIPAQRRSGAPGVYLSEQHRNAPLRGAKIAALGLKISRHCSFHGLALNYAMDLQPFSLINPCGYEGMVVTDMRSALQNQLGGSIQLPSKPVVSDELVKQLTDQRRKLSK